jgi:hypothetical protein
MPVPSIVGCQRSPASSSKDSVGSLGNKREEGETPPLFLARNGSRGVNSTRLSRCFSHDHPVKLRQMCEYSWLAQAVHPRMLKRFFSARDRGLFHEGLRAMPEFSSGVARECGCVCLGKGSELRL